MRFGTPRAIVSTQCGKSALRSEVAGSRQMLNINPLADWGFFRGAQNCDLWRGRREPRILNPLLLMVIKGAEAAPQEFTSRRLRTGTAAGRGSAGSRDR